MLHGDIMTRSIFEWFVLVTNNKDIVLQASRVIEPNFVQSQVQYPNASTIWLLLRLSPIFLEALSSYTLMRP
jgi:hypothetical protein